jgi:hypothetical protein
VKTENPSACATVRWKVCNSATALYLSVFRRTEIKVLINPIVRTRTRYFRHVYHPTRNNTLFLHNTIKYVKDVYAI